MVHVCLNCGKELQQTPGKRIKKFCDNTCRSSYWNKHNKDRKTVSVPVEEWNKIQAKLKLLKEKPVNPVGDFVDLEKSVEVTTKSKLEKKEAKSTTEEMPKGLSLAEQIEWRINHNR